MKQDYSLVLQKHYADAKWALNGDDYNGLTWLSNTAKPSKAVLDDLWDAVQADFQAKQAAKATAKAAAQAKLAALGLTVEDLQALGL